jgi:hypothetical protein
MRIWNCPEVQGRQLERPEIIIGDQTQQTDFALNSRGDSLELGQRVIFSSNFQRDPKTVEKDPDGETEKEKIFCDQTEGHLFLPL